MASIERGGRSEFGGIHLGDEITARINYGMEGGTLLPPEKGRVVYIHPEGRFFTAEFTFAKGSFRESFAITGRITSPMWGQEPAENGRQGPKARWLNTI